MCITTNFNACNDGELFFLSKKQKDSIIGADLTKAAKKYIEQLFSSAKVDDKTKRDLQKYFFKELKAATEEGYGKPIAEIQYGTPNYDMLKNLQVNCSVFSMFKSEALIDNAAKLLKDQDGNIRTKQEFYREALKLDSTYKERYASVEYDTAVRQARMAAIWTRAQESKDLYPNLEYVRTRSANPREDHLAYVGIILPIDDPFWNSHYPPLGFGCKCYVKATDEDPTDVPGNLPKPDKGFDHNSGKTGECFDLKNSEYIKSVPPADQPKLIRKAEKIAVNEILSEAPYRELPGGKKGSIEVHPLTFINTDLQDTIAAARILLKAGVTDKVKLLPVVSNDAMREKLLPKDVISPKNPDYQFGGKVWDLRTISGDKPRTAADAIDHARQKGGDAIIHILPESKLSVDDATKMIKWKFKQKETKDQNGVHLIHHGEYIGYISK